MSDSHFRVTGPNPNGLLGRLVMQARVTHDRLDRLSAQVASGRSADTYADLGVNARTDLRLHPIMAAMGIWQRNIDAANSHASMTSTAMDRMIAIAQDFYAKVNTLNGLSTTHITATASAARDALREIAGLLNTNNGGVYIFSGQDSANPPVPDGDAILSSGFYTQISTSIALLSVSGAAATSAATLAIASSNTVGSSPFSAYLSQSASILQTQRPSMEIADQHWESYGLLASANMMVTSSGASTTGSYIRDLMRSLATLGSLSSTQVNDPGMAPLVEDTRSSLRDAIAAMSTEAGILGNQQARMTQMQSQSASYLTILTGQVANIEDVDLAAALSSLSQVQTQMQASYHMMSTFGELSLVKYLS